jgi:hypothetical protein
VSRYAVAAERARAGSRRPVPPWHAADLLDDDPALHAGELVVSLCGVGGLRVFPLEWGGVAAGHGCAECVTHVARSAPLPG